MKIFQIPHPLAAMKVTGGVHAVAAAYGAGLAARGVEYVKKEKDADLVVVHAIGRPKRQPDVLHTHGMYPTGVGQWNDGFYAANANIIDNAMKARLVTAVSEWSADIFRRELHLNPVVIRNGIFVDDYPAPAGNAKGMVLWPKLIVSSVCDPAPAQYLAGKMPEVQFGSIAQVEGLQHVGTLKSEKFLQHLRTCSVYLGTTLENNSVGTMEAMACGIPVVGYDWGFNHEWLVNGRGCELVAPGDLAGLEMALRKVRGSWKKYSHRAYEYATATFGWDEVFDWLYDAYSHLNDAPDPDVVSVVIPLHNYARYVRDTVQSVLDQQTPVPIQIVVVDDASTDHPEEVLSDVMDKIIFIRLDQNVGVAEARNIGITESRGNLLVCLDADDLLAPGFVKTLLPAFHNRRVGVAFTPVQLMGKNGEMHSQTWFTDPYSHSFQRDGHNRCPSCCMFRREAWKRAGGYRKEFTPAEDANLWLRISSLGWQIKKVGEKPRMRYRIHDGGLSRKGFPGWYSQEIYADSMAGSGPHVPVKPVVSPSFSFGLQVQEDSQFGAVRLTLDSLERLKERDWMVKVDTQDWYVPDLLKSAFPFVDWNGKNGRMGCMHKRLKPGDIVTEAMLKSIRSQLVLSSSSCLEGVA